MGRKKLYNSAAERSLAYYHRRREKDPSWHGSRGNRTSRGAKKTKGKHGFFVAWDGEGVNTGRLLNNPLYRERKVLGETYKIERVGGEYAEEHIMNVFAYSNDDGSISNSYAQEKRLSTEQLLRIIGEGVQAAGKLAIHISFAFSYDVTHILYDVPRAEIAKALTAGRRRLSDYGRYGPYIFKYRPRKLFYVAKLQDVETPFIMRRGKWALNTEWSVTIWDVWGFFQASFLKALHMWNVGTDAQRDQIEAGKEGRGNFALWTQEAIKDYNNLELTLLCTLMGKVRDTLSSIDLHLSRWDGAGAAASALLKKELPKNYIRSITLPQGVEEAAYYAYAGGRAECIGQGVYNGSVYRADINSAYPDAMRHIPDLTAGEWSYTSSPTTIQDFGLYHVRWSNLPTNTRFHPFFYRDIRGSIYFPASGENWLWGIEYNAYSQLHGTAGITVLEGYDFTPYNTDKPFSFIERYYKERLAIKERIARGEADETDVGKSLVIKLALNSLYGKTIQKVGTRYDDGGNIIFPPYYNIVIGSYIPAYTRAKLYRAGKKSNGVILYATDGIISTEPFQGMAGSTALGEWELSQCIGVTILGSGIYWTNEGGKWVEKTRGFDKASADEIDRRETVLQGWKAKQDSVTFPLRRFVGIKYASLTDERWALRGAWITDSKEVQLWNAGTKREATPKSAKLWKQMYITDIASPVDYNPDEPMLSTPRAYPEPEEDIEE